VKPASGGRVVLELEDTSPARVRYRAALFTPEAVHHASAEVALEDGLVTFGDWDPPAPPEWLVAFALAFLRSEWRARRGTEAAPWPARISRWRAPSGR
jgi:hypothetical protein